MTVINWNLGTTILPTRESSALTKVMVLHDSQGLRQSNRWVGQVGKWDMQHVGMLCYSVNQSGVGPYYSQETTVPGATITHTRKNPGDDWGDGNTVDYGGWGNLIEIGGTISPNFQELSRYGISNSGFLNAYPVDNRHYAKVITRDAANTFQRYRLTEFRGAAVGLSDDFGLASDPGDEFDESGALRISEWAIRSQASLGSTGDEVGIVVRDSNSGDTDRDMQILGALVYSSPASSDFESTGLIVANCGYSGWSASDHINANNHSQAAKEALTIAASGYDSIVVMLGHNAEDAGVYEDNIETVIAEWKAAHTANGYSEPDIVLVAPWYSSAAAMTQEKNDALFSLASLNGYGFISLWESYGGVSPDGRTQQLDGTAATYAMDPTHPSDTTTAQAIALDLEWHFQVANHITELPPEPVTETASTNIMRLGAELLSEVRHSSTVESITYKRDAQSVAISATVGRVAGDREDLGDSAFFKEIVDWIVRADDLVLGGSVTLPQDGDTIEYDHGGGVVVYQIRRDELDQVYRRCDEYGLDLRIHTVRLGGA